MSERPRISRRALLQAGGLVAAGGAAVGVAELLGGDESGMRASCFVARVDRYEADVAGIVERALAELGAGSALVRGKRVVLKPNLVETSRRRPHVNTSPAVVVGVAEAMRALGAREVIVAEGQGHRRDSLLVLDESGMGPALAAARIPFVDLNHDAVVEVANAGTRMGIARLYLPRTLLEADVVVSLPKVKTHHWAGVTCSMKNLFGVMPGVVYGWPKNLLHKVGIPNSILDITQTITETTPALAIADGIVGMEGDGPIMGAPKQLGALVIGTNLAAVDATCTRLMGLEPKHVAYLAGASGTLGPILEPHIEQRGEPIDALRTQFEVIDLPHLSEMASG